jgi:hypothetical protein
MTIDWIALLPAILLLWFPTPIGRRIRWQLHDVRHWFPSNFANTMSTWINWVDLLRALVGAWVVMHTAVRPGPQGNGAVVLQGSVLGIGVLMQTVRYWKGVVFVSPLFFLSGVTLALPGWEMQAFAVFVGWLFGFAAKNAHYVLPAMMAGLGAGGYLLNGFGLPLFMNIGLIALPLFLSILFLKVPAHLGAAGR